MATRVIIPHFGTSVDQVTLIRWLKEVGEPIRRGEGLCEIETDKAVSELESFAEGVLLKRIVEAGADVQIGSVIAYIGQPGEEAPTGENEVEKSESHSPQVPQEKEKEVEEKPMPRERHEIKASPKVRRLAKDSGVDLSRVEPTGRDGRITEDDVRALSEGPGGLEDIAVTEKVLSENQRAVIRRITRSHNEIVPLNLVAQIKMERAIAKRQKLQENSNRKISFDAIFVHAVSRVMREFPDFRCYFSQDKIFSLDQVNVGLAISTDDALYIPVVQNADGKSLQEIDGEIKAFVEKARESGLTPHEISGATFTISNLGMFPVEIFNVIIPPGQSGALAIGCIRSVPVVQDDHTLSAEPVVKVLLSVDHRLINGRIAGKFLNRLIQIIEARDEAIECV